MKCIIQSYFISDEYLLITHYSLLITQNDRPPELFCGFPRKGNRVPIQYPVACFPQAWATGSIFQLLQMIVNAIPDAVNNQLLIKNPCLPKFLNSLSIEGLKVGKNLIDLHLERLGDTTICNVVRKQGNLEIFIRK